MKENANISKNIIIMSELLPDCCQSFLMETGTEMASTTRLAYARELNWFFDHLIEYNSYFCDKNKKELTINDIKKISSQDISRYLTVCKDAGLMERTLARKRASLSRFFTFLTNNRQIDFNPVNAAVKVKIHQSDEVTYLDINEQIDFINAIESGNKLTDGQQKYHDKYKLRDSALIILLLDTGMRVSELNGINIHDFDFDNCSVIVSRKGGNLQTIYFSDDTREILQEYLASQRTKFPELTGDSPFFTTITGKRLSVRSIEVLVKKYAISAVPGKGSKISPHKMRSSFAMEFYGATKDILALQRKLGHKNITATNIYAKATDKKMQETRNILSDKRNKNTKKTQRD